MELIDRKAIPYLTATGFGITNYAYRNDIDEVPAIDTDVTFNHIRNLLYAEQNGLLEVKPCQVGSNVWVISTESEDSVNTCIFAGKVSLICSAQDDTGTSANVSINIIDEKCWFTKTGYPLSDLGINWFLSYAEAEKELILKAKSTPNMKIYSFDAPVWPYTAIICARNAEQAREVYFEEVCTPDEGKKEPWESALPEEITREKALAETSNKADDSNAPSNEAFLDMLLVSGAPAVFLIDEALI